jgi:hypothetical protein
MYQTIVLGLGFLLVFGGGYLIKHSDNNGVLASAIAQDETSYVGVATSTILGPYLCDSERCPNPRELSLMDNDQAILTTTYSDGVETLKEVGSWKFTKADTIILTLLGTSQSTYDEPYMFSLKRITEKTLVPSDDIKATYKDLGAPIFRKEDNSDEQ